MAACRLTREWKLPRRMRCRVRAEKKVSTAFSHDPEVGVKWKVHRSWRASQAYNLSVPVGGVVVDDLMDELAET